MKMEPWVFKMWDSLNEPLFWNTLDEAVEWLSVKTEKHWSINKLINFAIGELESSGRHVERMNDLDIYKRDSLLQVIVPRNANVGGYVYKNDLGIIEGYSTAPLGNEIVKVQLANRITAPLFRGNLYELLLYGETNITFVCAESYSGKWYFELFEPILPESKRPLIYEEQSSEGILYPEMIICLGHEFVVNLGMVGIRRDELNTLLECYLESEKEHKLRSKDIHLLLKDDDEEEVPKGGLENTPEFTNEQYQSYDSVTKKHISTMFRSERHNEKWWASKFDKASRNRLADAREGKKGKSYLYNPVKVAEWLIREGSYSREYMARKLDNNLPPRSFDLKGVLFLNKFDL